MHSFFRKRPEEVKTSERHLFVNEFSHKYLKLFEKQRLVNDMKQNSFIYKIYELVSVFAPMQDSFLNMLHLISDEYFFENNFQKNIFF